MLLTYYKCRLWKLQCRKKALFFVTALCVTHWVYIVQGLNVAHVLLSLLLKSFVTSNLS